MRKGHIIGGLVVFGCGVFLLYLNSAYTVEFIKGALQPIIILIGLIALAAAVLGPTAFRKVNYIVAVVFLFLGLYGLYDEYYVVVDFVLGLLPILLIAVGVVSAVYGVKRLS